MTRPTPDGEVDVLRAEYARLAGRPALSRNVVFLRERVAQLRAATNTPVEVGNRPHVGELADQLAAMRASTVPVDDWRMELITRLSRSSSSTPHDVVARALDRYFVEHGLAAEVQRRGRR